MNASDGEVAGPGVVTLDPGTPLSVRHTRGPMTIAVVSLAWLRLLDGAVRQAMIHRHLDRHETDHASSSPIAKRRDEWLGGRLAVKHSVCSYRQRQQRTVVSTRTVVVTAVPAGLCKGRPLVNHPVHVSLSHSADFAVAVCASRSVGLDIERIRPLADPLVEALDADGTDSLSPTLRWSCKEAVLKCLGVGLRMDFRQVVVTGRRPDGRFSWRPGARLRPHVRAGQGHGWVGQVGDYSLALAWEGSDIAEPGRHTTELGPVSA